jgi:hypothetical protein
MFIDSTTSRADLLNAIYGEGLLFDHFFLKDLDPEFMTDAALLAEIQEWISLGDECASAG